MGRIARRPTQGAFWRVPRFRAGHRGWGEGCHKRSIWSSFGFSGGGRSTWGEAQSCRPAYDVIVCAKIRGEEGLVSTAVLFYRAIAHRPSAKPSRLMYMCRWLHSRSVPEDLDELAASLEAAVVG